MVTEVREPNAISLSNKELNQASPCLHQFGAVVRQSELNVENARRERD
jgi:hypothetical protein